MFRNTQPGLRSPFCASTRTWTVSMAARPPGSASNSIQSSPSTAAASHDLACSSEFSSSIPSLSAVALSVTLSASPTGAAVRFSLEQPLAARSFGPASNQSVQSSPSTAAASHDLACSSEFNSSIHPLAALSLSESLSASSTVPAQRSSLEQPVAWSIGPAASASTVFPSAAAASCALACSSEFNSSILRSPLHRMAQGETLSASSTGSAGRPSLEQPRAARSFGPASNHSIKCSHSTAAASRGVACSSECPPRSPLHRMAQSETLSSSSTVAAERSSL